MYWFCGNMGMPGKLSDTEFLTERQMYSISVPPLIIPLKLLPVFYRLIKSKDVSFTVSRNHSKLYPRAWSMKQWNSLEYAFWWLMTFIGLWPFKQSVKLATTTKKKLRLAIFQDFAWISLNSFTQWLNCGKKFHCLAECCVPKLM